MSKESGIFLQMRREGVFRLVVLLADPAPLLQQLQQPLGQGGKGPAPRQLLGEAMKDQSVRFSFQRGEASSQRGGPERWLTHAAASVNVTKSQVICGSVTSDHRLPRGTWQCGKEQRLSHCGYENAYKPFRIKPWQHIGAEALLKSVEAGV